MSSTKQDAAMDAKTAAFYAQLEAAVPGSAVKLKAFVESCAGLEGCWAVEEVLVLRIGLPGALQTVIGFESTGVVQIPWMITGHKEASRRFALAVERAVEGAKAWENKVMWTVRADHPKRRPPLPIGVVLAAEGAVHDALADLIKELKEA